MALTIPYCSSPHSISTQSFMEPEAQFQLCCLVSELGIHTSPSFSARVTDIQDHTSFYVSVCI